jgi:hypothetical protein
MAVELRCPECRAKLRLPADPEPGTDVECPKCANVFPAPDPDTGEVPDRRKRGKPADEDRPRKPASSDREGGVKQKAAKAKGGPNAVRPKKRRAKKKKANPVALTLVIVGAVMFVIMVAILLIWFFTRKPASYEMMGYLPADADSANGANIRHLQKYPELFQQVQNAYAGLGFYKAATAVATAADMDVYDLLDYVVSGSGKSGSGLVLRTKKDFDASALAKLPGAQEQTIDGQKVYTATHYVPSRGRVRVFAPTSRLIVFSDMNVPDDVFRKLLKGNKDNDKSLPARAGPLGKRITRGTYWYLQLYESADSKPQAPKEQDAAAAAAAGSNTGAFQTQFSAASQAARGWGFKASVGSRAIRLEVATYYPDSDAASTHYEKYYKNTDLAKGDEVEPPKWWKEMLEKTVGGDKKVAGELLANLGAKSSGDMFIIYSEVETRLGMPAAVGMVSRFSRPAAGPSGPVGAGAGIGGGAGPPGGMGP